MDTLKDEMLTQNKRGTAYPIFIVVEDKKVYGFDSEYADDKERKEEYQDDEDMCENCRELEQEGEDLPNDCDLCDSVCFVNFKIEKDVPILRAGFFFTAKACNDHIEANRHHYGKTARSYAISAYHNKELKAVMVELVGKENEQSLK